MTREELKRVQFGDWCVYQTYGKIAPVRALGLISENRFGVWDADHLLVDWHEYHSTQNYTNILSIHGPGPGGKKAAEHAARCFAMVGKWFLSNRSAHELEKYDPDFDHFQLTDEKGITFYWSAGGVELQTLYSTRAEAEAALAKKQEPKCPTCGGSGQIPEWHTDFSKPAPNVTSAWAYKPCPDCGVKTVNVAGQWHARDCESKSGWAEREGQYQVNDGNCPSISRKDEQHNDANKRYGDFAHGWHYGFNRGRWYEQDERAFALIAGRNIQFAEGVKAEQERHEIELREAVARAVENGQATGCKAERERCLRLLNRCFHSLDAGARMPLSVYDAVQLTLRRRIESGEDEK